MNYELLRNDFKPLKKIRILFVGESRPANETFFYKKDSPLFNQTKMAFEEYYGKPLSDEDFLSCFKKYCWLYDVCENPVNNLGDSERKKKVISGIPNLKKTIENENPDMIILIGKSKKYGTKAVAEEIEKNYVNKRIIVLPFPAYGRDDDYRWGIISVLKEIKYKEL